VSDTRSGSGIGQGDVYHILAPQCHRQDSARLGEYHPLLLASADAPRLVERPAAVLARVGGMDQEVDVAGAGGIFDTLGTVDEVACARFHAKAIESLLAEGFLDAVAKVGGDRHGIGFEGALEGGLELALSVGLVELGAGYADPRAPPRRAGADVRCNFTFRRERKPD
jgi:hypothetical protein